jgi:uncharacterized protein YacL (UPF0231 family)
MSKEMKNNCLKLKQGENLPHNLMNYEDTSSQSCNLEDPFYIVKSYRQIIKKSKQRIYNRGWLKANKLKK